MCTKAEMHVYITLFRTWNLGNTLHARHCCLSARLRPTATQQAQALMQMIAFTGRRKTLPVFSLHSKEHFHAWGAHQEIFPSLSGG
jgi:hypothetical protein